MKNILDSAAGIQGGRCGGAKGASKKQERQAGKRWLGAVSALLILAVLGSIFLRPGGLSVCAIAQASYPRMAPYPSPYNETAYDAWRESVISQRRNLGDITSLQSFFAQSARIFLGGAEGKNRVFSPLNLYMALAVLAQLSGGESREQILSLLGSGSMDSLRQQAGDVWNSNYRDDGALTSVLACSLWLNQDMTFNWETMNILARDFYASSYRGEMGSAAFNEALQSWLNEQTGGLLGEQAGDMELDGDSILALAATVCFQARWHSEFAGEKTAPQIFHASGGDVEANFMHQRDSQTYFWGDKFAAVKQPFEEGGSMWFLLPDEGVTPEALLGGGEALDFLFTADKSGWERQKFLFVNKSVPKFDVSSRIDLEDGLKALGITDIFEPERSDFTPMATDANASVILSEAGHAARVIIDEEGCTAAAFTAIAYIGAGMPPDEEVDFVLDRPFLFCVTGESGLPLFVGIVNDPHGA